MLCRFKRLIYPKTPPAEDSGYRIVLYQPCETVRDAAGHLVTEVKAVGFFLPTGENRSYELKGRWGRDSKYGVQFEVEDYREVVAPTKEGIVGYLSSGQIKGIGPKTAEKIFSPLVPPPSTYWTRSRSGCWPFPASARKSWKPSKNPLSNPGFFGRQRQSSPLLPYLPPGLRNCAMPLERKPSTSCVIIPTAFAA